MGTPHYSAEDFVYNGMYIPKNTVLVLNCYNIHHNEERYPDSYVPVTLVYARADVSLFPVLRSTPIATWAIR
jgi:cytochrome P450